MWLQCVVIAHKIYSTISKTLQLANSLVMPQFWECSPTSAKMLPHRNVIRYHYLTYINITPILYLQAYCFLNPFVSEHGFMR